MKAKIPRMYTENEMNEFLAYHEMIFLLSLHSRFGFGAVRMRRVMKELVEQHNHYTIYNDHHDPKFGSRTKDGRERSDLWTAKRDLRKLGYDWDEETRRATG